MSRPRRAELRRERDLRRAIASVRRVRHADATVVVPPQFDPNLSPLLDASGRPRRH
jgi:hypothetical protein